MKQDRCDYSSRKIRAITECNLQYTRTENCSGIVKRFKLSGFVELQLLSLCEWDFINSKDIYFLAFEITQEKPIQDTFRASHFKRLSLLSFEFHWYHTGKKLPTKVDAANFHNSATMIYLFQQFSNNYSVSLIHLF
jgi:hypothetical protein